MCWRVIFKIIFQSASANNCCVFVLQDIRSLFISFSHSEIITNYAHCHIIVISAALLHAPSILLHDFIEFVELRLRNRKSSFYSIQIPKSYNWNWSSLLFLSMAWCFWRRNATAKQFVPASTLNSTNGCARQCDSTDADGMRASNPIASKNKSIILAHRPIHLQRLKLKFYTCIRHIGVASSDILRFFFLYINFAVSV